MDELFDVFNDQAVQPSDDDSTSQASRHSPKPARPHDKSKKRNADGAIKYGADFEEADGGTESADVPPKSKSRVDGDSGKESNAQHDHKWRIREDVAEPILTDTFQTAESRQLTAAKGLDDEDKVEEESMVLSHNIQHQVALPPDLDYEYIPLSEHKPPEVPARTWNFKLDPFQSLSVASIERDESVLVSAHTSAGKTVVAEYAIAHCLKQNQRVIYTSPIKALSNQKYRDFEAIFGDVGLMTGDTTINPTASCLVMTTEILRSMLYRGSEIIREVAWVVFDEIHYMRDKVRGVVWEETIILLPDKVRYVFLSATIPNAFQFAEWIAKIHHQACHVVYTDFRPTPLQCYFCPIGGKGLHLVIDEKSVFRESGFNRAMSHVERGFEGGGDSFKGSGAKGKGKGNKGAKDGGSKGAPIKNVVKTIMEHSFQPVIFFSFSKRDCENHALSISGLRFVDKSEKAVIRKVFNSAVESLPESDRALPQILHIFPLLEKGIGVHHSGLLPIMKETIEILFQESLIKVLFATETFSIGLNMPAKTVVFTQVRKFDGFKSRPLTPSEYIQMSGRAGRRGLDARGIVFMMIDDKMDSETFKEIVVGQQDPLNSAFYLGYNMILNLLRIEAISPEFMLERSFHQFQNAASVPALEKELTTLQQSRDGMVISDEATIKDYYMIRQQLKTYHGDMRCVIQQPEHCLSYLVPGRLVQIYNPKVGADDVTDGQEFGWGVVVKWTPCRTHHQDKFPKEESYVLDVFLPISASDSDFSPMDIAQGMPPGISPEATGSEGKASWVVVPCLLTCLKAISQIRIFMPRDFRIEKDSEQTRKAVGEVVRRFPDGLPILDPLEHMSIKDEGFKKLLRKIEVLESRLLSNPLHDSPLLPKLWDQYYAKHRLGEAIKEKKRAIARAHTVAQLDELKARKRVLRRLGFINEHEVVQLKARVACEISSSEGHELVISELLFDGFFNDLAPETVAAILSTFIFTERNIESDPLKENLARPFRIVQAKARQMAKIAIESKLDVNEEEYVQTLGWQLMETVHAWTTGATFNVICKMSTAYEGTIIRLFRRLEELLRQMGQAANVMGSSNLTAKFEECLKHIRRDLVATQSLFI